MVISVFPSAFTMCSPTLHSLFKFFLKSESVCRIFSQKSWGAALPLSNRRGGSRPCKLQLLRQCREGAAVKA